MWNLFGMPLWLTSLWPVAAVASGVIILSQLSEQFTDKNDLSGLGGRRKPSNKSRRYPTSREVRVAFKMAKGMR